MGRGKRDKFGPGLMSFVAQCISQKCIEAIFLAQLILILGLFLRVRVTCSHPPLLQRSSRQKWCLGHLMEGLPICLRGPFMSLTLGKLRRKKKCARPRNCSARPFFAPSPTRPWGPSCCPRPCCPSWGRGGRGISPCPPSSPLLCLLLSFSLARSQSRSRRVRVRISSFFVSPVVRAWSDTRAHARARARVFGPAVTVFFVSTQRRNKKVQLEKSRLRSLPVRVIESLTLISLM